MKILHLLLSNRRLMFCKNQSRTRDYFKKRCSYFPAHLIIPVSIKHFQLLPESTILSSQTSLLFWCCSFSKSAYAVVNCMLLLTKESLLTMGSGLKIFKAFIVFCYISFKTKNVSVADISHRKSDSRESFKTFQKLNFTVVISTKQTN